MNDDYQGKIDAKGEITLYQRFWAKLKEITSAPEVSQRLAQAVKKKRELDWYDIRSYDLKDARKDELITNFPTDGDCLLVLECENQSLGQTYIKFDSSQADAFDLTKYRRIKHNFSNLYLTNVASPGHTLYLLFGRGDWEVERHHKEEEIMAINADTVDSIHASASRIAGYLLALGADGMFPDGAVRNIQHEIYANRPDTPVAGDMFIATDTGRIYVCYTDGTWSDITPAMSADEISFTPAGDIASTDVQAAIEELDTEKLADIADVIKDTHIDWGTGANQVSAADIPIADAGGLITATQVEGALQEIMTDLNGFPDELKNLDATEIEELEHIGVATISSVQWAFLGAMGAQPLENIVEDATPQLGGDLDAQNHSINNVLIPRYAGINLPAGSWNYPTSNPAPLERITGTNSDIFVHSFNDTTEEFILFEPGFQLPNNLDTAGTVYFEAYGMAKTAAADKAVVLKVYYVSKQDGEDPDVAYASKSSGAKSTNATQGRLDKFTFSETVATLGLAADDLLKLKLSRDAGNALDTLVDDYRFCNLRIRIPVT